jgi:alpha-ketoglutarate-dependent taurine dioxygenase
MAMTVRPLDATLGGVVEGVQLRHVDDPTWRQLEDAFLTYGVLVFHGQFLSRDEQVAFGRRVGQLERADGYESGERSKEPGTPRQPQSVGAEMIANIANIDRDGQQVTDARHRVARALLANGGWHSDSSYKEVSAKASILAGIEVTSRGGQTEFADMRAAYDALPPDEQERLTGLRAWHSVEYSQAVAGATEHQVDDDPTSMRGAWHPVVRRHPETGRPSLFIGRHAGAIDGMATPEAQAWLDRLLEAACQPPRIYSHPWRAGDVVMWDNRCVLHRVREWDFRERRVLRHVRVGGVREETAQAAS